MKIAQGTDWIRPRYLDYISGKRDRVKEIEHMAHLMRVPDRDRTRSWAASGAGTCLRARQFAWWGMPAKKPSKDLMNIFENGHAVHRRHQSIGLAAGYLSDAEIPFWDKTVNLRGTMDAMSSDGVPVEYKSINSNGFRTIASFGADPKHNEQMHSYMWLGGFDAFRIVYENKDTNAIREFLVKRDEGVIASVRVDINALNEANTDEKLIAPLPECQAREGRYRQCPFAEICLEQRSFSEMLEIATVRSSSAKS